MTARSTYESTVKTAAQTKTASVSAAETSAQETINASGCNVGYNLQTGNNVNLIAAIKSAVAAKLASVNAAEAAKQAAIAVAKDTLRSNNDFGPA